MGQIMGGIVLIVLFAVILEWAIFQRVFDDPLKGKMTSVVLAYVLAALWVGWGNGPQGGFDTLTAAITIIPATVVGAWFYHRGMRLREEISWPDGPDPELQQTFE